ncbi:MAG: hypothetical protein ACYCQJ_12635 [Nitrososphaerales archaeon]
MEPKKVKDLILTGKTVSLGPKLVRTSFQLEYEHERYGTQLPGLGDFLRGACTIWEICQVLGFTFELYLHNHPVKHFLSLPNSDVGLDPRQVHLFRNWNNPEEEWNRVVQYILDNPQPNLATNMFSLLPPNPEFKAYLQTVLCPNLNLQESYDRLTSEISGDYTVLHLRSGDPVGPHSVSERLYANICKTIETKLPEENIYIFADNTWVRDRLAQQYGFKVLQRAEICHLAHYADRNLDAVGATMLEFFFMAKAKQIIQLTIYDWGSGFSDWCAKIFDIPLERYLLTQ